MLLLIAASALMVLWLLGMEVILLKQHYPFQANRVRHKKGLSSVFIGLQVIHDTRIRLSKSDIESAWQHLLTILNQQNEWV